MAKQTASISASWGFNDWPADVWPGNGARAQRLVRQHSDSLLKEGAISRIGREIVIFSVQYDRWMRKQAHRVRDFDCALNRPEHLEKRVAGQRGRQRADVRSM